eukprot:9895543-Alexandrium_andersonii.AAC.1
MATPGTLLGPVFARLALACNEGRDFARAALTASAGEAAHGRVQACWLIGRLLRVNSYGLQPLPSY